MKQKAQAFLSELETGDQYSPNTRQAYEIDLQRFIRHLENRFGRPPVMADFNPSEIDAFLEAESLSGKRNSTLARREASLRRFETYLLQKEIIDKPVMSTITSPKHRQSPQPKSQYNTLSSEQIHALKNLILAGSRRPLALRDHAILMLLLETGISVSTLIALNEPEIDIANKRLYLKDALQQGSWINLDTSIQALSAFLKEARPELNPAHGEKALFISQTGNRMSRQGIWQIMSGWGEALQPPVQLTPRLLRHTAALRLLAAGLSPDEIQARLGHTNPLSTRALLRRLKSHHKG